MSTVKIQRKFAVYIDGFNLYHAVDALGDHSLKWINLRVLAEALARQEESLSRVCFFTAVLQWNQEKQQRHRNYIAACRAVGVEVIESNFKKAERHCRRFDRYCKFDEEKQTDVAFALTIIGDALDDVFDRAVLITADSDQVPTLRMLRQRFPSKTLSLVAPPGRLRNARELGQLVDDRKELSRGQLATCRLPRDVLDQRGRRVATMPALYQRPGRDAEAGSGLEGVLAELGTLAEAT
jgi:uncharacterized LabA/DUF88 family protein